MLKVLAFLGVAAVAALAMPEAQAQQAVATPNGLQAQTSATYCVATGGTAVPCTSGPTSFSVSDSFAPTAIVAEAELCGSTTKIVRVRSFYINGAAAAAGSMHFALRLISTKDSGGSAATILPFVPGNTATAGYQHLPTVFGTLTGNILNGVVPFPLGTALNSPSSQTFFFGQNGLQPITINANTTVCVDVALTGTLPTTPVLDLGFTWTEETN